MDYKDIDTSDPESVKRYIREKVTEDVNLIAQNMDVLRMQMGLPWNDFSTRLILAVKVLDEMYPPKKEVREENDSSATEIESP